MGKTVVEYYLMDGNTEGRIQLKPYTLSVDSIKIPKTYLECEMADIPELAKPGVYMLLSRTRVYIGQAGTRANGKSFIQRWNEHVRGRKNWWDVAVAFYSHSSDPFDSADIDWLESEMVRLAKDAARFSVDNGNQPYAGNLSVQKRAVLENNLESIKLLLDIYGYPVFRKKESADKKAAYAREKQQSVTNGSATSEVVYLFRNDAKTRLVVRDGKYIVLKGSGIIPASERYASALKLQHQFSDKIGNGVTDSDVAFKTPSAASAFVCGKNTNGWVEWKTADGHALDEFERKGKA
jgi:hypothetical protein